MEKRTERMKHQVKLLEMVSVSGDGGVYEEMREREARRINMAM